MESLIFHSDDFLDVLIVFQNFGRIPQRKWRIVLEARNTEKVRLRRPKIHDYIATLVQNRPILGGIASKRAWIFCGTNFLIFWKAKHHCSGDGWDTDAWDKTVLQVLYQGYCASFCAVCHVQLLNLPYLETSTDSVPQLNLTLKKLNITLANIPNTKLTLALPLLPDFLSRKFRDKIRGMQLAGKREVILDTRSGPEIRQAAPRTDPNFENQCFFRKLRFGSE